MTERLWLAVVCLLLLVSTGLAIVSLVPGEVFYSRVASLAVEGSADPWIARVDAMQSRAAWLAGLVFLLGVGAWCLRSRIQRFAGLLRASVPGLCTDARVYWARLTDSGERPYLIGVLAITGIAVALRLTFLDVPAGLDESQTFVEYATRPWYVAASWYETPNNHILHTLLVHLAYVAGGTRTWLLRMPAFLAGVLLVPATYLVARPLYGRAPALLASGLTAASTFLVLYSVRARAAIRSSRCCSLPAPASRSTWSAVTTGPPSSSCRC